MARTYTYNDQIFYKKPDGTEINGYGVEIDLDGVFKTSFMFGAKMETVNSIVVNGSNAFRQVNIDTTKKNQWEKLMESVAGEYQADTAGVELWGYHNANGYISKLRLEQGTSNKLYTLFLKANLSISGTTEDDNAPVKKPLKINGKPVKGITLDGKKVKKIALNGKEYEF